MPIVNSLPYNILDGTAVDAVPVMANYNQILNDVNNNAVSSVSPTFTGVPTAPTAAQGVSTAQIATTAFVTVGLAAVEAGAVTEASITAALGYTPDNPTRLTAYETAVASTTGAALVGSDDGAGGTLWTTVAGFITRLMSSVGSSVVGFIQAGTGAITRTAQNKMREQVNALDFGAIADFGVTSAATNNTKITAALAAFSANGGVLNIPKGVQWGPIASITWPFETTIVDESGWDSHYSEWDGTIRTWTTTASPGTKNAHEFVLAAPWNPAFVADNINTSGTQDWHGGLVMRLNGVSDWQLSPDKPTSPGTQRTWQTNFYGTYAGTLYSSGTVVQGIDPYDGTFGFNTAAVTGIDYFFNGVRNASLIARFRALGSNGITQQFANAADGVLASITVTDVSGSGSIALTTAGGGPITANGIQIGSVAYTRNVLAVTSYTLVLSDQGKLLYENNGSASTFTIPPNASVAFPIGAVLKAYAAVGASALTLARGAGVTLYLGGGTTSKDLSIPVGAMCDLIKVSTDVWVGTGVGVS